jgi:hypothetical protein
MKAFEGIRNWRMVASSDGRKAERTRDVFPLRGFPSPPIVSLNFEDCTQRKCLSTNIGLTLETIHGRFSSPSDRIESRRALFFNHFQCQSNGFQPSWSNKGQLAGVFIIQTGQLEKTCQTVELVFALEDGNRTVDRVNSIATVLGNWQYVTVDRGLERIAIWCHCNVFSLRRYGASEEKGQRFVLP